MQSHFRTKLTRKHFHFLSLRLNNLITLYLLKSLYVKCLRFDSNCHCHRLQPVQCVTSWHIVSAIVVLLFDVLVQIELHAEFAYLI